MSAPAWANRIVRDVARSRRLRPPLVRWRQTRRRRSAGSADSHKLRHGGAISVTAGLDLMDQRLVLCHELAHWLGKPDEGHSPAFWKRAWRLYRRYRVPVYYALAREGAFDGAVQAYKELLKNRH